jgi:tetratricopeptide (TPR) repeat protein
MENIEKLEEKVSKDPTSKLFVPLAEEYRKAGRLEEAVDVLKKGIEHQPDYMSARTALGKIYLEMQMKQEAREEFEKVVSAIPDNLFAQRKLADIYSDLCRNDEALRHYETVLRLNPMDEEARQYVDKHAAGAGEEAGGKAEMEAAAAIEALSKPEEPSHEAAWAGPSHAEERASAEEPSPAEEHPPAEEPPIESFGGFGAEEESSEKLLEEIDRESEEVWLEEPEYSEPVVEASCDVPPVEEPPAGQPHEEGGKLSEEGGKLSEEAGKLSEEALEEIDRESEEVWLEEPEYSEPVIGASCDMPVEEKPPREEEAAEPEETISIEELEAPAEGLSMAPEMEEMQELGEAAEEGAPPSGASLARADSLIERGEYVEAMSLYKSMLSREPENRELLQRTEELRTLLKLLGKDKELVEANLGSFLEGIKKRRDEFFGSA